MDEPHECKKVPRPVSLRCAPSSTHSLNPLFLFRYLSDPVQRRYAMPPRLSLNTGQIQSWPPTNSTRRHRPARKRTCRAVRASLGVRKQWQWATGLLALLLTQASHAATDDDQSTPDITPITPQQIQLLATQLTYPQNPTDRPPYPAILSTSRPTRSAMDQTKHRLKWATLVRGDGCHRQGQPGRARSGAPFPVLQSDGGWRETQ